MNELELLFQISNIVNGPVSFAQAREQIARLLEREVGVHTVERDGGEHLTSGQREFQQRLAEFVGEQLGMLAVRARLSERRAQMKREIARIEEDLA